MSPPNPSRSSASLSTRCRSCSPVPASSSDHAHRQGPASRHRDRAVRRRIRRNYVMSAPLPPPERAEQLQVKALVLFWLIDET